MAEDFVPEIAGTPESGAMTGVREVAESVAPVRGVLLGAPGSGKGTQATLLSKRLGVPAISTGEMLREAVLAGSDLGKRTEEILMTGAMVDNETMAEVVKSRIAEEDAAHGFLLDGYPRNHRQAETLAAILEEIESRLDIVWFVDVPKEELMRRALARQREDDREDVIKKRLQLYKDLTDPLVGYYDNLGLVAHVDGDQSIERVTEAMMAALDRAGESSAATAVDASEPVEAAGAVEVEV